MWTSQAHRAREVLRTSGQAWVEFYCLREQLEQGHGGILVALTRYETGRGATRGRKTGKDEVKGRGRSSWCWSAVQAPSASGSRDVTTNHSSCMLCLRMLSLSSMTRRREEEGEEALKKERTRGLAGTEAP